jgi:hypothetical protein
MAGATLMILFRLLMMGIGFCLCLMLSAPTHSASLEAGWQQARIQHVLKARKVMDKERARKREQESEKEQKLDVDRENKDKASDAGHS